jgi:hypothetical protein
LARKSAILKTKIMEDLQVYVQNNRDGELDYDYDLIMGGAVDTLKYSDHKDWTCGGETALKLTDDGNGIKFKFPDKKVIELDYSEAREMLVMLMMHMDEKIEIRKSELIKTI